eukprot:CAMPEP_0182893224 /NCGR_PEP_ID=MMETSP0034_2-20130328/24349_1 /TAXON_ID=156128 /ORGANISM="Nephroselmis pyriformis, Strain CCMP717" /LENGTH=55 /DNA_ID=CAMNT_0025026955 /DNA_START=90 /DNA_END=253 /DNA_ORIENTATION=+
MAKIEEKLSTRSTTLAAMLMFVAVILMPATVSAEEKTELGDWEVHHIVLPTTFLT